MDPLVRLEFFICAMLQWEVDFDSKRRALKNEGAGYDSIKNLVGDARQGMERIFKENLSRAALRSRALASLDALVASRPPVFAQKIVPVVERCGKFFYIETINERDLIRRRKYALVVESGDAKIDKIYVWDDCSQQWESQKSI